MSAMAAEIARRMTLRTVLDEDFRKKVLAITVVPFVAIIIIVAMFFYLVTHPLEAMGLVTDEQIQMVEQFQQQYGYIGEGSSIDITGDYVEAETPLFLQTDKRWGEYPYGKSGTISSSGCGPTSLAMIIVGLTGDTSINPKVVSDWSYENGHRVEGVGSAWSLFPAGAANFGIRCSEIGVSKTDISQALREGKSVITSMTKGHFTSGGHFIVLRGITEDGKILVNDPNSTERSRKEWDIEIVAGEARGAWVFSI